MHRRFTLFSALIAGAFAAVAALPLVSACQRRTTDSSILAADAQAAAASPPTTAETVKQVGPMPSLAPLVKQLRPVVVNINSRIKPRQGRVSQRMPRAIRGSGRRSRMRTMVATRTIPRIRWSVSSATSGSRCRTSRSVAGWAPAS